MEKSRHTQLAASSLNLCLAEASELTGKISKVTAHEDLDNLASRMEVICSTLTNITHRTASLDILKSKLCTQLGLLRIQMLEAQAAMGERSSAILVQYGTVNFICKSKPVNTSTERTLPQFSTLIELSMSLVLVLMLFFGLGRLGCDFTLRVLKVL